MTFPMLLFLLGSCPIVDRGSPTDGVTTISDAVPGSPCAPVDPWIGWECRQVASAANDNGVLYGLDLRWNRPGEPCLATFLWLRGASSTQFHRDMDLARQAQDDLDIVDAVRTIELRFAGAGTRTFPANGLPNISAVLADVWEYVVAEGIAEGTLGHVGISMGATQCAAALAYHDLDQIIDGAVLGGGPFWSDLEATCTDGGSPLYGPPGVHQDVDGWGYTDYGSTPCQDETPDPVPAWGCRSILGAEAETVYPALRIALVVGTLDSYQPWMDAEVAAYLAGVSAAETLDEPAAPHTVWESADGAAAMLIRIREIAHSGDPVGVGATAVSTWARIKGRYRP